MTAGALLLMSGGPIVAPEPMFLLFFAGTIFGVFGLHIMTEKFR